MLVVVAPCSGRGADILYKVPLLTYHAYNLSGGGSLYGPAHSFEETAKAGGIARVNLHRPGGGIGGPVKGTLDAYDLRTPRQTFAHWDGAFIRWLESQSIACDYCTDLDLHEGRYLADGYRLLLSAGHDEYWTEEIRRHTEGFRNSGGNIANFGANTCWWRVRLTAGKTIMCCEKFGLGSMNGDPDSLFHAPDKWWEFDPENTLTGVSYRNGGGHWGGERPAIGYSVQDAKHWVFEGTGLFNGDVLGAEQALVGYECDGAQFIWGRGGDAKPTGIDGTPVDFEILGVAELPQAPLFGWKFSARASSSPVRAATLGLYTRGGTVFAASTTDWPRALADNGRVERITRNVIARLSCDGRA